MLSQQLVQGASPGTFHILPPLTRSLEKLHRVIDQEMYAIGAQKLIMPCLAPKQLWDSAGNRDKNLICLHSLAIILILLLIIIPFLSLSVSLHPVFCIVYLVVTHCFGVEGDLLYKCRMLS